VSDQPTNSGDDRLFQNADEQERIYAPQQVPGARMPGTEADADTPQGGASGDADVDTAAAGTIVRPSPDINTPQPAPLGQREAREQPDG
jgi:hypothetical protein